MLVRIIVYAIIGSSSFFIANLLLVTLGVFSGQELENPNGNSIEKGVLLGAATFILFLAMYWVIQKLLKLANRQI